MFQRQRGKYPLLVGAIILLVLGTIDIVVLNLWVVSRSSLECEQMTKVAKQHSYKRVDTNHIDEAQLKGSNGNSNISKIVGVENLGMGKETGTGTKTDVSSLDCSTLKREAEIPPPQLSPSLPNDVIVRFAKNQSSLTPKSIRILEKKVIAILKQYPETKIRIEGHTDQKGPKYYNYRLSQCRVAMVVSLLMKRGIALERIEAHSYGSSYPLEPQQNTAKNRRVELRIIGKH